MFAFPALNDLVGQDPTYTVESYHDDEVCCGLTQLVVFFE